MRLCLDCGTPTPDTRCPHHRRARHTTRYGADHKALRRRWQPIVAGGHIRCARCGLPIELGDAWDLDHLTNDRRPAHAACNRRAGRVRR